MDEALGVFYASLGYAALAGILLLGGDILLMAATSWDGVSHWLLLAIACAAGLAGAIAARRQDGAGP